MKTLEQKEENRAEQQAAAQVAAIVEMVRALEVASSDDEDNGVESARQAIQNDPLEVSVRGDWIQPGGGNPAVEFKILLCTGGPAVRIVGDLSEHAEPESARVEYQDWFTPWTEYRLDAGQAEAVLAYCREFYFGN